MESSDQVFPRVQRRQRQPIDDAASLDREKRSAQVAKIKALASTVRDLIPSSGMSSKCRKKLYALLTPHR